MICPYVHQFLHKGATSSVVLDLSAVSLEFCCLTLLLSSALDVLCLVLSHALFMFGCMGKNSHSFLEAISSHLIFSCYVADDSLALYLENRAVFASFMYSLL
jgi:hypothetical protein